MCRVFTCSLFTLRNIIFILDDSQDNKARFLDFSSFVSVTKFAVEV